MQKNDFIFYYKSIIKKGQESKSTLIYFLMWTSWE
jgi:hypothetical protein